MKWIATVTLVSLVAALATIDAAGNLPTLEGPGITLDESFNVDVGWYIIEAESAYGLAALAPTSQTEIFGYEGYNPDHPPLGRLFLGLSNAIVSAFAKPEVAESARWSITAARPAAAIAFALTVLLVGSITRQWTSSTLAGAVASLVLATTPRVFGHAHIASLESFIGLAFAACVLITADRWAERPTSRSAALGGFLWGLALLTKIQAVLIPIPLAVWALWHFRKDALMPLVIFGGVGWLTFFIGWPWLWIDPVGHTLEYFGRGTDRIALNVFFAGSAYGDRDVPLLYTATMFFVAAPILWHAAFAAGAISVRSCGTSTQRRRWQLVLGVIAFVLLFFTLPNISVYDGVRLYLVAYPLWATLAGSGVAAIWQRVEPRMPEQWRADSKGRQLGVAGVVIAFGSLLLASPYWLSHYSAAVGGLRGATALGFETTYWGETLTRSFWDDVAEEVPAGSRVALVPTLHQFQTQTIQEQTPALIKREIQLVPWSEGVESDYVVAFRRRADISPKVKRVFEPSFEPVLVESSHWGVRVAALVESPTATTSATTD